MNWQLIIFLLLMLVILFAVKFFAKKYTMSVAEFKSLFTGMNYSRMIEVTTVGPFENRFTYMSYPIDILECYDKRQNRISIKNSPAIEVQFTNKEGKSVSVYFDTIRINGTVITSGSSRFATDLVKSIDLNDIEKIGL